MNANFPFERLNENHLVHCLVPNGTLVGGLVVLHSGRPGECAVCSSIVARLFDLDGAARYDGLIVAVPGDVGLRVAALREAAKLILDSLASRRTVRRAGRNLWRLRGNWSVFVGGQARRLVG